MDFIECANHLADAAGRALGAVISRPLSFFLFFTKLFNAMVIPVMDYSAGVWGFKYYNKNVTAFKLVRYLTFCVYITEPR